MTTPTTIIQLSDIHLVPQGQMLHGAVHPFDLLDDALARIDEARLNPAVVLITGDITDRGDLSCYAELEKRMNAFAEPLGIEVVYSPGNHDDRENLRKQLLREYEPGVPIDQLHWVGDLRIISMDSVIPGADTGELRESQLIWLARQLSDAAPGGTILTLHHPPVPSPAGMIDAMRLREPDRLAEVIRGTDVRMILAGHAHHASAGILGGVPVWCSPATAYYTDAMAPRDELRGLPGGGFSRIDLQGDSTTATFVPNRVEAPALYHLSRQDVVDFLTREGAFLEGRD